MNIQQIAKAAIDAAGDDIAAAKQIVKEQADANAATRDALIDYAISAIVSAEWRSGRQARWGGSGSVAPTQALTEQPSFQPRATAAGVTTPASAALMDGMRLTIQSAKDCLMDYEMEPGTGKRLGDCTKPDILRAAGRLSKQAETMKLRGAWLNAVAAMMPDNRQLVKTVLREADLERLQRRVQREAA